MKTFLPVFRAALSLLVLRRPRVPAAAAGISAFWIALGFALMAGAGDDWLATDAPRQFEPDGLRGLAFHGLLALAVATLFVRVAVGRPALVYACGAIFVLLVVLTEYVLRPIEQELLPLAPKVDEVLAGRVGDVLWMVWIALALTQLVAWLAPERRLPSRLLLGLLLALSLTLPRYAVSIGNLVTAVEPIESGEPGEPTVAATAFDTERVMSGQGAMLDQALGKLFPQRPGQVDLYVVAFGGDAEEDVFRNEVEYTGKLFSQRFQTAGRTLLLLNHPDTTAQYPLATRSNLHDALSRIGTVVDREEDIVLVFLASHGTPEHELYVKLDPLPLYQLTPQDLRAALDASGIRNRVLIVSACFAGGFIPALRDDATMVIVAARADRSSFGCGAESEITWFGRALLVDALNQVDDFGAAFASAQAQIARWEDEQQRPHSYPEIVTTPRIDGQLKRWRQGLHAGFPVPFRVGDAPL